MPRSKVDLNWTVPGNTFQLPISKFPLPWPSRIIPHGQLHPTCRWSKKISWRPVTVFFPDVHTSNHAIGTTATFTKIPTQYQAAWVNESQSAKVFKKKREKKKLPDFTSWSSAKKRSKSLGVPQFAAQKTSNARKSEPFFWSCPLGWSSDVCDAGLFAPLLFAHWLNALLVQGTHSSLESLKFLFSLGLKINNRCSHRTHKKKTASSFQANQTGNCQWPIWTC